MKTMKKGFIGADAAIVLARLQIDLLQKVRSGQVTLDQLKRFNNLSSADRDRIFSGGNRKRVVSDDTILARLNDVGYLDMSFDGRETHPLNMLPLTKEEAFAAYRTSGGEARVWDGLEKIPYTVPKAGMLDVMLLDFRRRIGSNEGVAIMDDFGVRPLVFEEHIQYGCAHPLHQERKTLVSLTKYVLGGDPLAPSLGFGGGERDLNAYDWGSDWDDGCRFLVVRK